MLEDSLYNFISYYQSSPEIVKKIFGNFYRCIPVRIKYGYSYLKFRKLLNKNEFNNIEKIREYQLIKIKMTLNYAYRYVPFYNRYWKENKIGPKDINTFNDFRKIPFVTKEQIRDNPRSFLSPTIPNSKILEVSTGGSTGEPLPLFFHKGVQRSRELAFMEKQWSRIGYKPGDRIAVLRSTTVEKKGKKVLWTYDPTKNRYIFSTFDLNRFNLPIIINQIKKVKPKYLHVYPSVLSIIINYMKEKNIKKFRGLKGVLCGSENTFPFQFNLFEKFLECKILRWYGLSEMVSLAGSCEYSSYYHCFPEYSYVELIDQEGKNVSNTNEFGEIVGTSFDNLLMPLIRYRTGDFATKGPTHCRCGRNHLLLGEIQGRKQEEIISIDGSKISLGPVIFGIHQMFWTKISLIQFVQHEKGKLLLKVKPSEVNYNRGKIIDFLKRQIIFKLEPNFTVEIAFTEEFEKAPSGKHKFLVSSLTQ